MEVQNGDLIKYQREATRLQTSQGVPTRLSDTIVPVIEVNPRLLRYTEAMATQSAVNATATTIMTTSSSLITYVTGVLLSYEADATATSLYSSVMAYINGAYTSLASIGKLTLTAGRGEVFVPFERPIKIDKNTIISITNSTNVANIVSRAVVYYYLEDNPNA